MLYQRFQRGVFRTALTAGFAVILGATTACGGADSATAPSENLTGSYALATIEGDAPPVTVFDGQARTNEGQVINLKVSVLDSEVDLDSDGSYYMALMVRVTVDGNSATQSISNEGTYERSGSSIEFESDDAGLGDFRGSVSGGRLKLSLDIMGNGEEYEYSYAKGR